MMPAGSHPDLNIPGPLGDHLGDRQHDVEISAPLGDQPHIGQVTTGVPASRSTAKQGRVI